MAKSSIDNAGREPNSQGAVRDFVVESQVLGELRNVSVFLPPGYSRERRWPVLFCADGQSVVHFAERLDAEMGSLRIPSAIVVGVHSYHGIRHKEYVRGVDPERFESHEQFFATEVYDWARAEFSIAAGREGCGVFGYSNGAAFALSIAARQRAQYGLVIAFSVPTESHRIADSEFAQTPRPRYYLSAGTRERPIRKATTNLAARFKTLGLDFVHTERHAGHEFSFWNSELPAALQWGYR